MERNNEAYIKNIPKTIRESIERNFAKFFDKEIKTAFSIDNPSEKMKSFIRISKRIKGFEGVVVLYHNKSVYDSLCERIEELDRNDYSKMEISQELILEFRNTLHSCREFMKRFTY